MDYLPSEMSVTNHILNEIHMDILNRQDTKNRIRRVKEPGELEVQRMAVSDWIIEIDEIPKNIFEFEGLQKINQIHHNGVVEWNRYSLKPLNKLPLKPMGYYLSLAYCIIEKGLKMNGHCPTEIAITFEKGEVMNNEINIQLSKDNIDSSSIIKFANIIDFLDLELELFVLWTDHNTKIQKYKRRAISGTTRQNVLMRDNYTCQICGATVKDGAKLELDHILPVSKGGTNEEKNLQVLCQQCNREKHNRDDLLHDKRKLAELEEK